MPSPHHSSRFIRNRTPCGRTRREYLWEVGGGFAGLALIDVLSRRGFFSRGNAAEGVPKEPGASSQSYLL